LLFEVNEKYAVQREGLFELLADDCRGPVTTDAPRCAGVGQEAGKDKLATQDASRKTGSPDAEPASPIGLSWTNSYIEQIGTSGVLGGIVKELAGVVYSFLPPN